MIPNEVTADLIRRAGNYRAARECVIFQKIWKDQNVADEYVRHAFFDINQGHFSSDQFSAAERNLLQTSVQLNWKRFDHLIEIVRPRHGERIIDIGCGFGGFAFQLRKFGTRVIAVDLNSLRLEQGRRVAKRLGTRLDFAVADATSLPISSHIADKIVCVNVFEHLPNKRSVLSEFHRVLKPNGTVFIYTDNFVNVILRVQARRFQQFVGRKLKTWQIGFSGEDGGHVAVISAHELSSLMKQQGFLVKTVYSIP